MPLTDHVPPVPTVAVSGVEEFVPSLATTETVAPDSPVPLAVVDETLLRLIGFVTEVMAIAGAAVSLVDDRVPVAVLPEESVAVAL